MDENRESASLKAEIERLKEENTSLRSQLIREDREIAASEAKLRIAYEATVQSLVRAIESKDPFTKGHYELVSKYAVAVGRRLNLDGETLDRLRIGGMLMDIGKVSIDNKLWTKTGTLSAEEEKIIRSHVSVGAEILDPVVYPWEMSTLVYQHQERFDGSGYPEGLKGEGILIEARILGVCDSFVAMMAKRAFREPYSREKTIGILKEESGRKYDPRVVEAFVDLIEKNDTSILDDFAEHFKTDTDHKAD